MQYNDHQSPTKVSSIKKAAGALVSLVVLAVIVLSAISIHGGMPTNLRVLACPQRSEFYGPRCNGNCPGPTLEMTVSEAFSKGFRPSDDCLKEGWFDEYDISLLRELLDKAGVFPAHPWNSNGTWRTSAFSAPLKSKVHIPSAETVVSNAVRVARSNQPPLSAEEKDAIAQVSSDAMQRELRDPDLQKIRLAVQSYIRRTGNKPNILDWLAFSRVSKAAYTHNEALGKSLHETLSTGKPVVSAELRTAAIEMEDLTGKRGILARDIKKLESVAYQKPWTDDDGKMYAPLTRKEIANGLQRSRLQKENFDKIELTMKEASD